LLQNTGEYDFIYRRWGLVLHAGDDELWYANVAKREIFLVSALTPTGLDRNSICFNRIGSVEAAEEVNSMSCRVSLNPGSYRTDTALLCRLSTF